MATLKVNVSLTAYMLNTIGLVMLGRFSGEYLYFCLCWSIVAEKLAVSGIVDLVEDMDTDTKR